MNTLSILKVAERREARTAHRRHPEVIQLRATLELGRLQRRATQPSASSATTTSEHLTMADAPYQREAAPDAYLALANAMRDQSEDRELPRAMAVAVENPSGVRPGLYYAVYDRATMNRVSVWTKTQAEAESWADAWTEEELLEGLNPASVNMVWGDLDTEPDWYEYRA